MRSCDAGGPSSGCSEMQPTQRALHAAGGDGALVALVEGVLRGEAAVLQRALCELPQQRLSGSRASRCLTSRGRSGVECVAGSQCLRLSVWSAQATWHCRSSSHAAAVYAHCGRSGAMRSLRKAGSSVRVQPGGSTAATALGRTPSAVRRGPRRARPDVRSAGSQPSGLRPGNAARTRAAAAARAAPRRHGSAADQREQVRVLVHAPALVREQQLGRQRSSLSSVHRRAAKRSSRHVAT